MVRWYVLAVTTTGAANRGVELTVVLGLSGVLSSLSSMNPHTKRMRKALTLLLWGWEVD